MNNTKRVDCEGNGSMKPTHEEIAVRAYELHERWAVEASWSPGALDPWPEHFWFEAEKQLTEATAV